MKEYIIASRGALEDEDFLLLLTENGRVVSVSENGEKTLFFWSSSNFECIDNINILGPFSKEEGLSNLG
jgi:hypothetical protein